MMTMTIYKITWVCECEARAWMVSPKLESIVKKTDDDGEEDEAT